MSNEEILKENDGKRFDICLMNPPYSLSNSGDQFYIKFVDKVTNISNKAIIISPSQAYLSKSPRRNKKIKDKINTYKPELILDNYQFIDAFPVSKLCISVWNIASPNKQIKVNNMYFDNQLDIVLNDNKYLIEFYNKLSEYVNINKTIYDKCVCNRNVLYVFDPIIRSKALSKWDDKNVWFVYIGIIYLSIGYCKYSNDLWNSSRKLLIPFYDEKQAYNCYITIHNVNGKKNDFNIFYQLIILLSKYMYINNIYMFMPWLDFSKSYTDEELFEMIGMEYNKEEIDKII